MVNKYYYIQRRGVTLKSNRSTSLKMGPIDKSYSRACVTITWSWVCLVSKQLASTSFRRQVLSTLLVQRWRGSSGNVRLSNLTRDIDIAILSVCPSVCLSVRDVPGLDENVLTYCHFFPYGSPIILVLSVGLSNIFTKFPRGHPCGGDKYRCGIKI